MITSMVTAAKYNAANDVANLDPYLWSDLGPKLNCGEAEAFYAFLVAWGRPDDADRLMQSHADDDDGDDDHKVDETDPRGWSPNDEKEVS